MSDILSDKYTDGCSLVKIFMLVVIVG